jgi:surface antigen
MNFIKYLAIGTLVLPMVACSTHEDTGTVVGAVAGGVIGNQFGHGAGRVLATAGGVVVGGLIGGAIGKKMDDEDRRIAEEAEMRALEDEGEEPARWRNERSGHYGYFKKGKSFKHAGMTCREYEHTVYFDGRPEKETGKACRQPDGGWKAV